MVCSPPELVDVLGVVGLSVTVPVAVDCPIPIVPAAPNAFTIVIAVLNRVSVPVELLANVGLAPLMLKVVLLAKVTVGLLTVVMPEAVPKLMFCAFAPRLMVPVVTVVNSPIVPFTTGLSKFTVPAAVCWKLTAVVPAAPTALPMLIVDVVLLGDMFIIDVLVTMLLLLP